MPGLIESWLDAFPLGRRVIGFVSSQGVTAYLVGGTVRDILLGRESTDLDLAIESGAMSMARRVADSIGGAYVPLDVERDVARVVVRVGRDRLHFDFAGLRAEDIEADLRARDYTVNAMAVRLGMGLRGLIDPTGGRRDLGGRLLRVVSEDAFTRDPVRILRGLRLSGELGFTLTPDTEALARAHLPGLRQVSPERVRDEIVRVLSLDSATDTLSYAGALGVLPVVLPEVGDDVATLVRGIGVVSRLGEIFRYCAMEGATSEPARTGKVEGTVSRYRAALVQQWSEELSVGRARWVTLKLAGLLSGAHCGAVVTGSVLARLRFGRQEVRFASATVGAAEQCLAWAGEAEPERVAIYRYYQDFGSAGVDGGVLALATPLPGPGSSGIGDGWQKLLRNVRRLLRAWFDEYETLVDPPRLLSGRELVEMLALAPGPRVGRLLEALREAQVQGLVRTRRQAVAFALSQVTGPREDEAKRHSSG